MKEEQYEEVIAILTDVIRGVTDGNEKAMGYFVLGGIYADANDFTNARKAIETGIELTDLDELKEEGNYLLVEVNALDTVASLGDDFIKAIDDASSEQEASSIAHIYINQRYFGDCSKEKLVYDHYLKSRFATSDKLLFRIFKSYYATCISNKKYKNAYDAIQEFEQTSNTYRNDIDYLLLKAECEYKITLYASLETLGKLEQLYRAERDNRSLTHVLAAMGDLESRLGDIGAAREHYAGAEQRYRTERHDLHRAHVFQAMGNLESWFWDINAAQQPEVRLYSPELNYLSQADKLKAVGDLQSRLGDIDAAQQHYADAEQRYRAEHNDLGLAHVLLAMGDLDNRLGDIDAAIAKYSIAFELYSHEQEPVGQVYCLAELCRAYAIKKDESHFLAYLQTTADTLVSVGEGNFTATAYVAACVREAMDIIRNFSHFSP